MSAQEPGVDNPMVGIYDYEPGDTYNPGIDTCKGPRFSSVSIVQLNGSTFIEVLFDPEFPAPTGNVQVSDVKLGQMSESGTHSYHWDGPLPENSEFSIRTPNPCGEGWITVNLWSGCQPQWINHPEFRDDYNAWIQGESPLGLGDFLNSLEYLTQAQRWSFYQSTFLNCEPITEGEFAGFINDSSFSSTDCKCDVITGSMALRTLLAGDQPPVIARNQDGSLSRAEQHTRDNSPGNGINRYVARHTIEQGATKHSAIRIKDLYGNNQLWRQTSTDTTGGGIRTTEFLVVLQCLNGEANREDCMCEKDVSVLIDYSAHLEARSEVRKAIQERASGALAMDMGYFSVDGDVQSMVIGNIATQCERDLNPAFVDQMTDWLTSMSALAIGLTDDTELNIGDTTLIGNSLDDLADLINLNAFIGTECETIRENTLLRDDANFSITPNAPVNITVGSMNRLDVWGQRSYDSKAAASSATAIAIYVSSQAGDAPDFCCSEHIGLYTATSLHPIVTQSGLHTIVRQFLQSKNAFFPGMNEFGDYGSRMSLNRSNDNCANLQYLPLILAPSEISYYSVLDIYGREMSPRQNSAPKSSLGLADGTYILASYKDDGNLRSARKIFIVNGELIYSNSTK